MDEHLAMNLKMDERARHHEPSDWRAAFTPLQLAMLRDLCTLKRRERRAPVQRFNAPTVSGNSLPIGSASSADAAGEKRSERLGEVSPVFAGGISTMPGCARSGVADFVR
jgi:hypothetical protein